jgi:hypothetical protein
MGGPSQVLAFEIGGRTVFVARVYHPAQPYMRPAAVAGRSDCARAVAAVIQAAL